MTRAKYELDLIAPLKYYVTQQTRQGDGHVYGTRSRFLTPAVMKMLHARTWPDHARAVQEPARAELPRVDVAARLRNLWA
jgi:DNA helicase-2/ATP-dependent DNA helicase PcrA